MANIITAEACEHVYPNCYKVEKTPNGPVRIELGDRQCGKMAWKKRNGKYICRVHLRK